MCDILYVWQYYAVWQEVLQGKARLFVTQEEEQDRRILGTRVPSLCLSVPNLKDQVSKYQNHRNLRKANFIEDA